MKERLKKNLITAIPFLILFLIGTRVGIALKLADGSNLGEKIMGIGHTLHKAFVMPFLPLELYEITVGAIITFFFFLLYESNKTRGGKMRDGYEYGSGRFGSLSEGKHFRSRDSEKNIILTDTESVSLTPEGIKDGYKRNGNVMIWGGSGSGKTRSFIKPNLMQAYGNYIVTDPKGELINSCGEMLMNAGYEIRVFSTQDFTKSMRYNPFEYLQTKADIMSLASMIIENTKGEGGHGEEFWIQSETLLYTAIISLILEIYPKEHQNFSAFTELLSLVSNTTKGDRLMPLFEEAERRAEKKGEKSFAFYKYHDFTTSSGQTRASINISCRARMAPFSVPEVRKVLGGSDQLRLYDFADDKSKKRKALFLIMSDTDPTYSFLMSMVYSQAFKVLLREADKIPGGKLPVPLRLMIDEAANIGKIPNLDKYMSVIRSRNIGAALVFQTKSQIKDLYRTGAEAICGNCDSELFLGGGDFESVKQMSERLGRETIDMKDESKNTGTNVSHGESIRKGGRQIMNIDDIYAMDGNKCLLFIRGARPFYSNKYDIKKHTRYKEIKEGNTAFFDIKKHVLLPKKVSILRIGEE